MKPDKLIAILGPTASGKSALTVKLAKKFNSEVISADSRQVYKGLDLASGKVSKKEMAGILHHCLDVASLRTRYTAAEWKKCAELAIKEIQKKGKLPIVVGGTAFYIRALINKSAIPEVKPNWKLRKQLEKKSVDELFKILKKLDPRRASTIEQKNKRRLIRAMEIVKTTGDPVPLLTRHRMSNQLTRHPMSGQFETRNDFDVLILGIRRDNNNLERRIENRLKKRLAQGMIKEIKKLHDQGVSWRRLEELGLEPRWIARFLQDKIPKSEMETGIIRDSLKFVRHQMAWWKKDTRIHWVIFQKDAEKLIKHFLN